MTSPLSFLSKRYSFRWRSININSADAVVRASAPLAFDARMVLAAGIGGFYFANALVGMRLGHPFAGIAALLIP